MSILPLLNINYNFRFPSGETRDISLSLDANNLALESTLAQPLPEWTALTFHQCPVCALEPALHPHCPVAKHLSAIVELFTDHYSCDEVTVTVDGDNRRYTKETTLQMGLSGLVGIIMVTSGCPVLDPLRPMVRFHLPFASIEETEFRMVSMYLLAQYFRQQNGLQADWTLNGLRTIYDHVQDVNGSFADRIRSASEKDAGVNAVVILDCFAKTVPLAAQTMMQDYEKFFATYLRE